jgi:hypothetical protein
MREAATSSQLETLLQHPSLWRGRNAAPRETFPTGFDALDRVLPGGGWPCRGLIEVLICGSGSGELGLWAPLVARLSHIETARWCAFVSPPFEPYAPAWLSRGARAEHLLVVRSDQPLWAMEQSLLSGACAMVFGWLPRITMRELRRLALAAEKGAALAVLIRPLRAAQEHSAAVLRMALEVSDSSVQLRILKGRGIAPQCIGLSLP